MATRRNINFPPPSFEIVVLTFKGHADGALGYHSGTVYWCAQPDSVCGPVRWSPVEDNLLRAWAEIPRDLPTNHGGPLYQPLVLPTWDNRLMRPLSTKPKRKR